MIEVIVVGNPNAGKTTLFNKLTRSHRKTANWNGVTVGSFSKEAKGYLFTDLPGIYSLNAFSLEEKLSASYIRNHRNAVFLNVVDGRNPSRALRFTQELVKEGIRPIIVLSKLSRSGGGAKKAVASLSLKTGLPVVAAEEFSADGLPALIERANRCSPSLKGFTEDAGGEKTTSLSKAEKILLNPCVSLIFFLALFTLAFFIAFADGMAGVRMKEGLERGVAFLNARLAENIPYEIPKRFICDCVIASLGGVLGFLPQIAILYLFLILLEESGLLSYAAFAFDGFFARFGLNGRAAFSMFMGFGCTAAAVCTARGQEDQNILKRTALAMQYIPCSARLPVVLTLISSFSENSFIAVMTLYTLNIAVCVVAAYFLKGKKEDVFLLEIPPLSRPDFFVCLKSLLFQLKQFIIKVGTVMLAFLIAVWLLSSFSFSFRPCVYEESMLAFVCGKIKFILYPMGITDWKMTLAALSGLAAKENIAGVLAMFYPNGLNLSPSSAAAFSVFVMLCPPCVSAFSATVKEIGKRAACLSFVVQTALSLAFSYAVYFLLNGGVLPLIMALLLVALFLPLKRLIYERICRKRKRHVKKFYR